MSNGVRAVGDCILFLPATTRPDPGHGEAHRSDPVVLQPNGRVADAAPGSPDEFLADSIRAGWINALVKHNLNQTYALFRATPPGEPGS